MFPPALGIRLGANFPFVTSSCRQARRGGGTGEVTKVKFAYEKVRSRTGQRTEVVEWAGKY